MGIATATTEEFDLKKIEAVIRSEKFGYIKDALAKAGYTSLTTYEVKGRGKQSGIMETVSGKIIRADLLPKTKIEIVANDKEVEKIIKVIETNAKTGMIGDGKIFISTIDSVIRIRTGESDSDAI
jgi:nitrogen regulatory protein P-II 1